MTITASGTAVLHSARRAANRLRGAWLLLIADGTVTVDDLISEATRSDGQALLKLSLRQVLLSQEGWGRSRVATILGRVLSVTGTRIETRQVTVGWLLDARAGGRRFAAWKDALETKSDPTWNGFPYRRGSNV